MDSQVQEMTRYNRSYFFSASLIILIALLLREGFFNGPLGSDDIVYLSRSLDVANGIWSNANYNGALRYGYNLPEGLILHIFGLNMFTANLWPLLCSLTEIFVVFNFSWKYISHKTAIIAALFLAFMPLHAAVATRLHADPVVSLFLTLSFTLFYQAEQEASKKLYFVTGLSLGWVFWVKELAVLTFFAFFLYPIYIKKIKSDWLFLIAGGLLMLIAHFALMQFVANDMFHAIKTVLHQVGTSFIGGADKSEDGPWFYFRYLFLDIKHTWLVPIFAVFVVNVLSKRPDLKANNGLSYTLFWLLSLLLVLSFFPVSLSPLKFAMKQSNYITLFLAPLTIISGFVVANMPFKFQQILIPITLIGGFTLAALEQQSYQVFTANSRGLLAFAKNHPDQAIYGSVNNDRIACFYAVLNGKNCETSGIYTVSELPEIADPKQTGTAFIVIDQENMQWASRSKKFSKPLACWENVAKVVPADTGNSQYLIAILLKIGHFLPQSILQKIQDLQYPKPAQIYLAHLDNLDCNKIN